MESRLSSPYDHGRQVKWGMPIKDSVAVGGMPTFRGCRAYSDSPLSSDDSPLVARLKEAGAIILGKTTQPDLGMLATGVSSLHGVTRNPWNTGMSPGGSSAGAGASTAAGVTPISIGTDIGGSIRIPAAHNGLVGMKPSRGRVAHLPAAEMRCAGPLTRTAQDAALVMEVISSPDFSDHTLIPFGDGRYLKYLARPLDNVRIGKMEDVGYGPKATTEILDKLDIAASVFEQLGAIVETFRPEFSVDILSAVYQLFQTRISTELRAMTVERRAQVLDHIRCWGAKSEERSALDFNLALSDIESAKSEFLQSTQKYDFVISPTLPLVEFPAEQLGPDESDPITHVNFTCLVNQTGQPSASICCGFSKSGMPIGLQIIGRPFDDAGVLNLAHAYEEARGFLPEWPVHRS